MEMTTVQQGAVGLTAAIYKLTKLGYTVAIPLIDNQSYDLLAEKEGDIYKVEVKSTRSKASSNNYVVQIGKIRPNRTGNTIHKFDSSILDYLFVYTADETCYLIPAKDINVGRALTLGKKWDSYKV